MAMMIINRNSGQLFGMFLLLRYVKRRNGTRIGQVTAFSWFHSSIIVFAQKGVNSNISFCWKKCFNFWCANHNGYWLSFDFYFITHGRGWMMRKQKVVPQPDITYKPWVAKEFRLHSSSSAEIFPKLQNSNPLQIRSHTYFSSLRSSCTSGSRNLHCLTCSTAQHPPKGSINNE